MSLGAPKIKVGDTIPMDVVVHQGFAGNTPDAPKPMSAFLKGKNVLLVSLPGAFTPT
jgi:peroxiredoxin